MSAGTNDVHATRELDEMITPAAAHAMLAAMESMADDELEEVIHTQMATTEEVVEFMKQLTRYSISEGTRISDVESPHFAVSDRARSNQLRLVRRSREGCEWWHTHDQMLDENSAMALTEEMIVACMNGLMLSESAAEFFGVQPPDGKTSIDHDAPYSTLLESNPGILCFQAWQLLLRTPYGRRTLLTTTTQVLSDSEIRDRVQLCDSFSAVAGVLGELLAQGTLRHFFKTCVSLLPVREEIAPEKETDRRVCCFSSLEKSVLLKLLESSEITWQFVRPGGHLCPDARLAPHDDLPQPDP
jgi:hypothetical protein